jgi:hypothetical protein
MKAEIYNALAAINRSFDVILESLTILKAELDISIQERGLGRFSDNRSA